MNVLDHLKDKTVEQIKEYCDIRAFPAAMAMFHITGDFNLGTVVRNANFFGFKEVFYIGGSKSWDRRSAVGTHHYTDLIYCKDDDDFFEKSKGYISVAIECNLEIPTSDIRRFMWPKSPVIVLGEEQKGISLEFMKRCYGVVSIPQHGSVRSLNVGTASGIAAYSYVLQHGA